MSLSDNVFGSLSEPLITGQFEWVISVCSGEIFETNSYLDSPTFCFLNCSWFIRMYPKGDDPSSHEWTSLHLLKKNKSQNEISVSFSIHMTFQDVHLVHIDGSHTFQKSMDNLRFSQLMPSSKILQSSSRLLDIFQIVPLSIKIQLTHVPCNEDALLSVKMKDSEILRQNFKDLLFNDENHDLILKVKGTEFKAHKIIMRFRCPVFKLMFSHDMLEKTRGVVEIPDCDPSAFEQFLFYVYTGNLEMLDESIMLSLYYIADKYDLPSLKEMCCEFIKKSVSTTNVCDVISLALNHSDSPLLECGEKYFVNNATKVLVTTEWQSFIIENPVHANTLYLKILDESVMLNLYNIADKYNMPSLKEMCCEFIKKSVSTTNVCDVISLALNHSDSPLLECAEKYFVDNALKVLVTAQWQSFIIENPSYVTALYIKVYNNCSPKDRCISSPENNLGYVPAS